MIIGTYFDGDDDDDAKLLQHNVYHSALRILTGTCEEYTILAHRILDARWDEWELTTSFDHHTLQHPHDIIAAVWRFRCLPGIRQIELPLDTAKVEEPDLQALWLQWLREYVESWRYQPYLIRFVIKILRNQNQPIGYRAETDLNWELLENLHGSVPWKRGLINAVEKSLNS